MSCEDGEAEHENIQESLKTDWTSEGLRGSGL